MMDEKADDLVKVADWAAYNGFDFIYAESISLLHRIKSQYVPSEDSEWRSLFFKVIMLLHRATNTREEIFRELLTFANSVEELFKVSLAKYVSQFKWILIRRQILTQIAICKLLRHMNITEDLEVQLEPNTLVIPANFNYAVYKREILDFYEEMKSVYPTDEESGQSSEEMVIDSTSITKELLTLRADGKKVFSKLRVIGFFNAHPLRNFKEMLIEFYRNIESIMLPTPVMSVEYLDPVREDAEVQELMRSSKKPVWSQDKRETFGPYSALKKTERPTTASSSSSAVKSGQKDVVNRRLSDSFQYVASASKLPASPSILEARTISPPSHRPNSVSSATSNSSVGKVVKPKSYREAAEHFNDKYTRLDPLNEFIVDASAVDGYHVRTSHENTALSVSKSAKSAVGGEKEGGDEIVSEAGDKRKRSAAKKPEPRKKAALSSRRSSASRGEKVDFDDEEEDPIDEEEDEEKSETSSDYLAMQTASASNGKNKRGPGKKTEGRVAAKALISLGSGKQSNTSLRFKWTFDEEEALIDGVKIHGHGNWALILRDPRYKGAFHEVRTNVHLKDKYRNMENVGRV